MSLDDVLSQHFGSSPHTVGSILKSIQIEDNFHNDILERVCRIDVDELQGAGFLSFVYRISLEMKDGKEKKLIVKFPTPLNFEKAIEYDDESREILHKTVQTVHDTEVRFYESIAPQIQLALPKVYASQKCASFKTISQGYLLMEDVSERAGMASITEGLTKMQVESALRTIAKFHAFSLTLPKDQIASFALEYPRHIEDHRLHIVERVLKLPTTHFAGHEEALRRFVLANEKMPVDTHKIFGIPPILVHGDFWTNNLFFKRDKERNVGDELHCILDWQCMHPGTGVGDVVRLLLVGVNEDLRRKHTDEWIKLYFDAFVKEAESYGVKNPFTLELIQEMVKFHRKYEVLFCMLLFANMIPHVTSESAKENILNRLIAAFDDVRGEYE